MKKLVQKALHNKFFKAVVTLMSGSIFAQVITVIASLAFARIYSPKELGIYTLILTAESLFGSVICLRYELLLVSEQNENKLYGTVKLCIYCTAVLSILVAGVYGGYKFIFKEEYRGYSYAVILIAIMLFFRGMINIFESYNNRCREYKLMTSTYIIRTVVQNGGAILLGLLGCGVFGIIISHTFGLIFGMKQQSKELQKHKNEIRDVSGREVIEIARENKRFPLFATPANFANRYSYSSITLFIEALFGATELGFYSISYKALGLPLTVLSNNVSKVFYREASSEYEKTGQFWRTFIKTSGIIAIISIPMGVGIYTLSPWIFGLFLGKDWIRSAVFVRILIPMFCVRFVVNTITYGLQIVGKQKLELLFQVLLALLSVLCYIITKFKGIGIEGYLTMITLGFSFVYILSYLCVGYYARGLKK